jgi:hypothetical protein
VEPEEVRAEQAAQDLLAPRQDAEDLGGGEGDVQEEADARVGQPLTQQARDEQQLIVVNPDYIARPVGRRHGIGEPLVDALVRRPRCRRQRQALDEIVEHRPQHAVREVLVVLLHLLGAEIHGRNAALRELRGERVGDLGRQGVGRARPSDPDAVRARVQAAQPGREPAGRRREADRRALDRRRDRQSVRNDEEPHDCGTTFQSSPLSASVTR